MEIFTRLDILIHEKTFIGITRFDTSAYLMKNLIDWFNNCLSNHNVMKSLKFAQNEIGIIMVIFKSKRHRVYYFRYDLSQNFDSKFVMRLEFFPCKQNLIYDEH